MSRVEVTCGCGHSRIAIRVFVGNQRVGSICVLCAQHAPTLRSFLNALGWFYEWRFLTFTYTQQIANDWNFRLYLDRVIDEQGKKSDFRRSDALAARNRS